MKTAIDHAETARLVNRYRPVTIAKELGCTPQMVSNVINGCYPAMGSEMAQRIVEHLRKLEVLVERPLDVVDESGWGQDRLAA
jgi:predicted transcriptional regulator